jgi:hypothetical protein
MKKVGIKERILAARSEEDIKLLLTVLRGYTNAHPSTVRKCERAAVEQIERLKNEVKLS